MRTPGGEHGREQLGREEGGSSLVPLRVDDFTTVGQPLHQLPHLPDVFISLIVPVPHHTLSRKKFGPQRMWLFPIRNREYEQRAVLADACDSGGELKPQESIETSS